MKKIVFALVTLCTLISCSNNESYSDELPEKDSKGNITFSFSAKKSRSNKHSKGTSQKINEIPFQIIATIIDEDGNIIKNNERYNLTSFNDSYITENIELEVGNYKLTGFNVINSDNEVILSTPVSGSEFAELVNTPLPISFSVTEGDTSAINPEVIRLESDNTPEQFGYISFTFDVVETVNLYIQLLVNGDSGTEGSIKIGNIPDNDFIERELPAGVNKIRIPLNEYNSQSIVLEITYPNFDVINIALQPSDLDQYSLTNPFVVNFDTPNPDTTTITATSDFKFDLNDTTFEENFQGDLIDIDHLDINGINYIVSVGGNNSIILIDSNTKAGEVFRMEPNESFSRINVIGETLFLSGFGGQLYTLIDFDSLSFSKHQFDFVKGDNVYTYGNNLFVFDGNQLYVSDDMGKSFKNINDNLPFAIRNSDIVFLNEYIYAYDKTDGQVFRSKFTDGSFFEDIFVMGVDYDNMKVINDDLIFTGLGLDNGQLVSNFDTSPSFTTISFELEPNDVLTDVVFVDGENVLVFTQTVYQNIPGSGDFPKIKNIAPVYKVTGSGNNQEIWGIDGSSPTFYSNLRR